MKIEADIIIGKMLNNNPYFRMHRNVICRVKYTVLLESNIIATYMHALRHYCMYDRIKRK